MSSKQAKSILVVNDPSRSYGRPLECLGLPFTYNHDDLFTHPEKIALVLFTGGEDVNPVFYGRTRHPSTYYNVGRDTEEYEIFQEAFANNIPMTGICRGSQFLCVMAGGVLVQDVTGHTGSQHNLRYQLKDGDAGSVLVNSTHHQMQYPWQMKDEDFEILGWTEVPRSRHYIMDKETLIPALNASQELRMEPDCVFYKKINALAMQYHPECLPEEHPGWGFSQKLVELYVRPLVEERIKQLDGEEVQSG